ncbi:MAG: hypothetical protein HY721_15855 [Planctomycetes bacterium]|nr:hypothetical protein [Planctomycetota bacterium]
MTAARKPFRRLVANLDAECELAREAARRRRERGEPAPSPRDPRFGLPARVLRSVSAFATLLRAFCEEGDRLWTPAPVDPRRMAPAPGLPLPVLESGPLERLPEASSTLRWCGGALWHAPPTAAEVFLAPGPWALPAPPHDAVLRANHRGLALEVGTSLGTALPGARSLRSVAVLDEHLASGGASAAPGERWVLKAPYSAAGRSRLRGAGRRLEGPPRARAARLLELFGELHFEPWMERLADYGLCGIVAEASSRFLPPHGLDVDPGGVFRGILVAVLRGALLGAEERALLERAAGEAAARLRDLGYRGPFGIDAWRYRDASGAVRFQPLGEINARLTFGFVAWALALGPLGAGAAGPIRLVLGDGAGLDLARRTHPGIVPLLLPGGGDCDADSGAAWLEPAP